MHTLYFGHTDPLVEIMNTPAVFYIAIALISSYLIGSLPTAYVVGRLVRGIDIRQVGSRNMGAMNVFYNVGIAAGLLVLAVDIGKGAAAVFLAYWLGLPLIVQLIAGALVVIGHAFPVWLRFRGGKGGATCIGVLAFLIPWASPFYLALFLILLFVTHFPTLSYSLAFVCFPIVAWLEYHSATLIIYSIVLLLIPGMMYIPRIKEIYAAGGGRWGRFFVRSSLKERL